MRCSALMVVGSEAGLPGLAGATTTCGSRPLPVLTANSGGGCALLPFWAPSVSPWLCFFLRLNQLNIACVPTGTLQLPCDCRKLGGLSAGFVVCLGSLVDTPNADKHTQS